MLDNLCFIFHKCHLFHNFIFFSSNNTFYINHALIFKYQPGWIKINKAVLYTREYNFFLKRHVYPSGAKSCNSHG